MLLLWPSTDLDDLSCSVFSLHTFLFACFFSGKPCEATWPLCSLVASVFDVDLFGPAAALVFGVILLMELQNYNRKFQISSRTSVSVIAQDSVLPA
jgi:hypothetical protein